MRETEIKILDIDRRSVEERLLALGARKTFEGEIHAIYLDTPERRIGMAGGVLRLRREGQRAVLTFKGFVDDHEAKVREEEEVEVSDFETARRIFISAGFVEWLEMSKERTTFEYDGVHFEFDKYHGKYEFIPEFLEIEAADLSAIHKYAAFLGFGREDCKPWDALQVAEHYSRRT